MNQIKELKDKDNNRFIIEITLITPELDKKIIISLFISAPVTVLELKKFLSKDFEYPIQSMIFFYPLRGLVDNSYIFSSDANSKIELSLIIDDKKNESNKNMYDIGLINKDFKIMPNNLNNYPINNLKNTNINNNFININSSNNNISLKDSKNIFIKPLNDKLDFKLLNSQILFENKNNINDNIVKNMNVNKINENKTENIKNINKFDLNNNIYQIKNNKCNFFLTTTDNKQKTLDEHLLGKKRSNPTTFKTTILNFDNENTKPKINNKAQSNNNIKIVNFNVSKSLEPKNEIK